MLAVPSLKAEWMCIAMLTARLPGGTAPAARSGAATGTGPTAVPIPIAAPSFSAPRREIADVMNRLLLA
ncbi:hypothetical protein [Micromonospora viridifaciens]|uniref:hypothetical protein n=1 Tax=Micromonospora viridifaciens TaxID=1881 RepID=UPI0012FD7AB8|nr:hypothetical protein [Micromonospora viridifaciens]